MSTQAIVQQNTDGFRPAAIRDISRSQGLETLLIPVGSKLAQCNLLRSSAYAPARGLCTCSYPPVTAALAYRSIGLLTPFQLSRLLEARRELASKLQ